MKVFVFVLVFFCISMVAHAECFTTIVTAMWFDYNMFNYLSDISTSPQDLVDLMKQAVAEGYAIQYPAGTRIDEVTKISETVSAIKIGNGSSVIHTSRIRCQ